MNTIDTDYLVVGAGGAGMAFVDALVSEADVDVVVIDKRHAPGGHWNDAYPFVRLHQPSAHYGVNSRSLGNDSIDTIGPNAGYYERATGVEICDYFQKVLDEHLVPSGRVRFFGMSEYVGDWAAEHAFTSGVTGRATTVNVRRAVVDGTHLEISVPATHTPSFSVDEDARLIPIGELVHLADAPAGFTVIGAGKTGMDACNWLLDNGTAPDRIRWIKPREPWVFDRGAWQPLDLVVATFETISNAVEALAQAEDEEDLFRRLEAAGCVHRVDETVRPTMFRGATLSERERNDLRTIEHVVRLGRVKHLGANRIELEDGTIPANRDEIHVDCSAYGIGPTPLRPIWENGRITIQTFMGGFTTYNAAVLGFVEAVRDDAHEKNRLCPPVGPPNRAIDWIDTMAGGFRSFALQAAEPDLSAWLNESRLNFLHGLATHMNDPRMKPAVIRYGANLDAALRNGDAILAAAGA